MGKCINVGEGHVWKYIFLVLRFISICDLFTDSPLYHELSQTRQESRFELATSRVGSKGANLYSVVF
jgi:hypothetical protein